MIPLILGAAALGTGAVGAVKGASGMISLKKAEKIGKRAQERYELAVSELKADWEATDKLAQKYGQLQLNIKQHTIGRFLTLIKRIGQQAFQSDIRILAALKISTQQFKEYKAAAIKAEQVLKGGAGTTAIIAGTAASQGVISLVGLFGTASTGAAISGLSGAAAWNATLAWLGGGSLAAGGGGMALGTIVLGGIAVGPALMIGGFMVAGQGEEALTKARDYEKQVNNEVAKIEEARDFLQQVKQQITKLKSLVENLNACTLQDIDELERCLINWERSLNPLVKTMPTFFGWLQPKSQPFESDKECNKFQQVALLVKALAEIMKTPVLDSKGQLNPATATIEAKYRNLGAK
jgi:hypothetical protein